MGIRIDPCELTELDYSKLLFYFGRLAQTNFQVNYIRIVILVKL